VKTLPILIALALSIPLQAAAAGPKEPAAPAKTDPAKAQPPPGELEKLAAAIKIGREWQKNLKAGTIKEGMKLWGYAAFEGTKPEDLQQAITSQGALKSSELLEERCLVDLHGSAAGKPEDGQDTYITLRWFSEYDKGFRRESLILHEPAKNSKGLKITGLRREELPLGRQGGFELAADLGQLAVLKLHQAPRERWEPYEHEAQALAGLLKVTLPPIPDIPGDANKEAGEKLVSLLMADAPPLFDKLGESGGANEAKMILNAFAMFMLYVPGEETSTRLAALTGAAAEKAKIPPDLWKPLIDAVVKKQEVPMVHEAIQFMVAGVSVHLGREEAARALKGEVRETLNLAFSNMARLPTYKVDATLTAPDARKSSMTAALAPGAMDLTLVGFDGQQQRRVVNADGFFISKDEGKTWQEDTDHEIATGLCRTLQLPVEPSDKITDKFTFVLAGKEMVDGEELFKFTGVSTTGQPPRTYWLLVSKAGPVIRRARLTMTFGTITADTLLIYTKLGKAVDIADPQAVEK
jgi:hypothetical protein